MNDKALQILEGGIQIDLPETEPFFSRKPPHHQKYQVLADPLPVCQRINHVNQINQLIN
jgi:hypothetical protein